MRKGYSAENFVVMRYVALNLRKKGEIAKLGVKSKRLKVGRDNGYLAKLL